MSGLGRRSHYRKHLTDSVWNDFPEPDYADGELIAKVVGTRGSNQFEIVVSQPPSNHKQCYDDNYDNMDDSKNRNDGSLPHLMSVQEKNATTIIVKKDKDSSTDKISQLAILPAKFRKLVWLKRNDFVIVNSGDSLDEAVSPGDISGGIRYMIKNILYKEQVKNLKQKKLWPNCPFFSESDEEEKQIKNKPIVELNNQDAISEQLEKKEDCFINKQNEESEIVYDDSSYNDEYFVNTNRVSKLIIDDSDTDSN